MCPHLRRSIDEPLESVLSPTTKAADGSGVWTFEALPGKRLLRLTTFDGLSKWKHSNINLPLNDQSDWVKSRNSQYGNELHQIHLEYFDNQFVACSSRSSTDNVVTIMHIKTGLFTELSIYLLLNSQSLQASHVCITDNESKWFNIFPELCY